MQDARSAAWPKVIAHAPHDPTISEPVELKVWRGDGVTTFWEIRRFAA